MSVNLGTLIRGISTGWRLAAEVLDKFADVFDRPEVTVSWEFGLLLLYLLVQRRWGWIVLSVTISLIVAYERGTGNHLSLSWLSAAIDAFAEAQRGGDILYAGI